MGEIQHGIEFKYEETYKSPANEKPQNLGSFPSCIGRLTQDDNRLARCVLAT